MQGSALHRTRLALGISVAVASALSMLWLLWRFPLATGIGAVVIIGLLMLLARLAKCGDYDALSESGPGDGGLPTR